MSNASWCRHLKIKLAWCSTNQFNHQAKSDQFRFFLFGCLSLRILQCRICSWVSLNRWQVLHHMLSLLDDFWVSFTFVVRDLSHSIQSRKDHEIEESCESFILLI